MIKIKLKNKVNESGPSANEELAIILHVIEDRHYFFYVNLNSFKLAYQPNRKKFKIEPGDKLQNKHLFGDELNSYIAENHPTPALVGYIQMQEYSDSSSPCFDAMNMNASAMHEKYTGIGLGKQLYKMGLAYAAKKYSSPVMPDRFSVSDQAAGLWTRLSSDSEVTHNFNKDGEPTNEKPSAKDASSADPDVLDRMDLPPNKVTKTKIDDCVPPVGIPDRDNPVNAAYYSTAEYTTLTRLNNKGEKFLKDNFATPDTIKNYLVQLGDKLFDRVYG